MEKYVIAEVVLSQCTLGQWKVYNTQSIFPNEQEMYLYRLDPLMGELVRANEKCWPKRSHKKYALCCCDKFWYQSSSIKNLND